ncbi:hypothetical protein UP17_12295 [Peribacillus simplex]|uniref:hypothetical protein n=1 Tax=Peribacillus simplex TaxID=1478 RepID=UPI000776BE94|nr:hypothetical protein [Peribacillus simplex]AMM93197.1 hypothetical protein UP17_12295 [Peribacillus simplex]
MKQDFNRHCYTELKDIESTLLECKEVIKESFKVMKGMQAVGFYQWLEERGQSAEHSCQDSRYSRNGKYA